MEMPKNKKHPAEGEHSYFDSSSRLEERVQDCHFSTDLVKVEPSEHGVSMFHKCKMCTYRTKSSAVMRCHVRRHRITRNSKSFDCLSANLEQYKCTSCEYRTHFLININRHMANSHCHEEVNAVNGKTVYKLPTPLMKLNWRNTSKNYSCDNCSFTTHSQIFYVAHYRNCPVKIFLEENGKKKLQEQKRLLKWRKKRDIQKFGTFFQPVKKTLKEKQTQRLKNEGKDTEKVKKPRRRRLDPKPRRRKRPFMRPLYCCWKCPFKSYFVSGYVNHLYHKHVDDNDIKWQRCDRCPYKSIFANQLKKHIIAKHKATTKCLMCPFQTKTQIAMKDHVLSKHVKHVDSAKQPVVVVKKPKKKKVQCAKCQFSCEDHEGLKEHILTHHVTTETVLCFRCGLCNYVTIEQRDLMEHVLGHVDPEGLQCVRCEMCDVKFRTRDGLKGHIFDKHIL